MKNIIEINGNETEVTMTRAEVIALHKENLLSHSRRMDLLETIREETGLNKAGLDAAREEQKELAESKAEAGLTTEINTSKDLVSLRDTIEGFVNVLSRHRFGYRGTFTPRGKFESFTPEETAAAEKWAAGPKNGKEWAETGKLSTDCWKGGE